MSEPTTCALCGTPAPADQPAPDQPSGTASADQPAPALPLTWTTAVENGRRRIFCPACSRKHLRAIESKLDSEWW